MDWRVNESFFSNLPYEVEGVGMCPRGVAVADLASDYSTGTGKANMNSEEQKPGTKRGFRRSESRHLYTRRRVRETAIIRVCEAS